MKALIDKFSTDTSRFEPLLLIVPFICWIICFFNFFNGHLWLEADAISYAQQISFYTDNLRHGIFPLWDPKWVCGACGAPYDFFLRRIGDVNPLLFLIVFLKWLGVSSATAYLVFLGFYYFLAGWAIYLITRFLLVDRFYAFTAYILFLFSSWGSEIFYNYIIIIFVPLIWFFYFLLCFARDTQRKYFLGMCLCAGLVVTTYVPFFFLTILTIFTFFYVLFYGQDFIRFFKSSFIFFLKNKIFTVFCIFFILVSCIPALFFYKESKGGEIVLPGRHAGSDVSSEVSVGLSNIASGDIISHGYFDRVFDDHAHIDMGDIYIPYVFFVILLITVFARANKLIFFLLFNVLSLALITITSAGGVHRFLYEHVFIFKFIRNIYYFFWLAMLPMGILLFVTAFKSLLSTIDSSSKRIAWLIYIIFCHVIFVLFLIGHQGVLWGAWAAILISLIYFLIYFRCGKKISYAAGFSLFLLAIFIQSVQVYGFLEDKLFQMQDTVVHQRYLPYVPPKAGKFEPYYTTSWFDVLLNYLDSSVIDQYTKNNFIVYDNVVPYADSPEFFQKLRSAMSENTNIAYVSKFESGPADWRIDPDAQAQADNNPIASGKLSASGSDVNTWAIKAHLSRPQFLVINDSYNSDWHAFINGHPVHLFRANVAFKGLWVPSGESNIFLRFSTPKRYMFHIALIILFAATFFYFLLLLLKQRKPQLYG